MVALRPALSRTTPASRLLTPDEVRDERRARPVVDLARRRQLDDPTRVHDRDAIGHRQRLFLIVRHVDERDADLAVQALELELHLLAELEVERPERLVEEQDRGLVDERPRERDPLLLAARELVGPPAVQTAEAHLLERLPDGAPDLGGGPGLDAQPERDVLEHAQVRKERVVLEDGVDVPSVGGQAVDALAPDRDRSCRLGLEAGDDAEGGGLPAAARAQESDELPARDVERHGFERDDFPESLRDVAKLEVRNGLPRGRLSWSSRAQVGAKTPPRRDPSLGPVVGPRLHRDYTAAVVGRQGAQPARSSGTGTTAPARRTTGGVRVRSSSVEAGPPGVAPPSRTRSTRSPRPAITSSAVRGLALTVRVRARRRHRRSERATNARGRPGGRTAGRRSFPCPR